MKLLYDRVLLRKIVDQEFSEGIIMHQLSSHMKMTDIAKAEVVYVGVECREVKPGDVVVYRSVLERFLPIDFEHLVELRESDIDGILIEENHE